MITIQKSKHYVIYMPLPDSPAKDSPISNWYYKGESGWTKHIEKAKFYSSSSFVEKLVEVRKVSKVFHNDVKIMHIQSTFERID